LIRAEEIDPLEHERGRASSICNLNCSFFHVQTQNQAITFRTMTA
jgi:hypothetical protein